MTFWDKITLRTLQAGAWIAQKAGAWGLLSKLWRFAGEEEDYPIPKVVRLADLEALLARAKWESDKTRLGDSISYPGAVRRRIDEGLGNDCDDFAVLACAIIDRDLGPACTAPRILAAQWRTPDGAVKGHAVCAFRDATRRIFQIGNWYRGSAVGPFSTYEEVARRIARDGNGRLFAYSLIDYRSLRCVHFSRIG